MVLMFVKRKVRLAGFANRYSIKTMNAMSCERFFAAYMRFGGMPGIADVGLEQEKVLALLDGSIPQS